MGYVIFTKVARSAISGRFVSFATARRWPETTIVETVRRSPRKRASRKQATRKP